MAFDLSWQMSFEDFKALNRAYYNLRRYADVRNVANTVIKCLFPVVAAVSFWLGEMRLGWLFVGFTVLLVFLEFVVMPWALKRRFNMQDLNEKDLRLIADEDALDIRGAAIVSKVEWSGVKQASFTEHHVILWFNRMQGLAVPHRAAPTPQSAQQFVAFVKEKTDGKEF